MERTFKNEIQFIRTIKQTRIKWEIKRRTHYL